MGESECVFIPDPTNPKFLVPTLKDIAENYELKTYEQYQELFATEGRNAYGNQRNILAYAKLMSHQKIKEEPKVKGKKEKDFLDSSSENEESDDNEAQSKRTTHSKNQR